MPSRYCEFASGDDQAIPYAVGMYKDHDGKYIWFFTSSVLVIRHAIFSEKWKSILFIKTKKRRILCEGGGSYEWESVKLLFSLIKKTWGLSRYEFCISRVIIKLSCPLQRAEVWGIEKIDRIRTESCTCRYWAVLYSLASPFYESLFFWSALKRPFLGSEHFNGICTSGFSSWRTAKYLLIKYSLMY